MGNHWYPGDVYTYTPPTRLELATRDKGIATEALARAKRAYKKACLDLTQAIADDKPKACTCNVCPTCGGTK
jgi:hypothetical protein